MNNLAQIIDNKNVDNLNIDNLNIDNSKNLIINIENIFVKKVEVGKYAVFEVIENIKKYIELNNSNVFIKTIYNEILWLRNKKIFKIEIENKIINAWFCKIISYDDLLKECNLTIEEKEFFISSSSNTNDKDRKNQSIDTRNQVEEIFRKEKIEYRRGMAGGGNQLRQPYIKKLSLSYKPENFKAVDHLHFYSWYIGNNPSITSERIIGLCDSLNTVRIKHDLK
jgi:CDP-6-deoxy-D-xylo-4-hexulose-3-dehydrase